MQITYQNYTAEVTFCRITSCFYGEVAAVTNGSIIFIASCKLELTHTMQQAIEHYLQYTAPKISVSQSDKNVLLKNISIPVG